MPTCSRQTLVKDHAFLVKTAYYLKSLYGVRGFCVCDISVEMCIRERHRGSPQLHGGFLVENNTIDATADKYWRALRTRAKVDPDYNKTIAATVSYTHLDVYKRQDLSIVKDILIRS